MEPTQPVRIGDSWYSKDGSYKWDGAHWTKYEEDALANYSALIANRVLDDTTDCLRQSGIKQQKDTAFILMFEFLALAWLVTARAVAAKVKATDVEQEVAARFVDRVMNMSATGIPTLGRFRSGYADFTGAFDETQGLNNAALKALNDLSTRPFEYSPESSTVQGPIPSLFGQMISDVLSDKDPDRPYWIHVSNLAYQLTVDLWNSPALTLGLMQRRF
jgi:hypothetical protein